MPRKYEHLLESDSFKQALAGDKGLQMGNLAVALSTHVRADDPQTANLLMTKLADAGLPEAHYKLSVLYLKGDVALAADSGKAVRHLMAAAELGHVSSMAQLGAAYAGREQGYSGSTVGYPLQSDRSEARKWYLRAADAGNTWCSEACADMLLAGRRARECSQEELREILRLYQAAGACFKLGNMYCVDKDAGDCTEEEVNIARRWYQRGRASQYSPCQRCADVLSRWDEPEYVPPPNKAPWTVTEMLASAVGLVLWAVIGTFLLGVALSVTSVTLPLVIGAAVLFALFRIFKSR